MKYHLMVIAMLAGSSSAAQEYPMYAGIGYASFSGENVYVTDGDFDLHGDMAEVFFGMDFDIQDNYVLGAEISITTDSVYEEDYEDEYEYTSIIDVKGNVGYQMNSFVPYGILGFSVGTFEVQTDATSTTRPGFLGGLGVEYTVAKRFLVSAEAVARQFPSFEASNDEIDGTVTNLSLRGAYKF